MTEVLNTTDPRLWQNCAFLMSGAKMKALPSTRAEVALAGRSNAGKSSALNALTGRTALARTSKTPGRTQLVNLFQLDEDRLLADLPGYGYAKAPAAVQRQWAQLIADYLQQREVLRGVVVIVDVRRGIGDLDRQLLDWIWPTGRGLHLLLSKADKLSNNAAASALRACRAELDSRYPGATAQLFSAKSKRGVEDARAQIASWLDS